MSPRSMTGYARARRASELGEVAVTVKSVNHRALDVHLHVAAELEPFEPALLNVAKHHISRGHVDLRVKFTPAHVAAGAALNRPLFEAYLKAVEEAGRLYGVSGAPQLETALQIEGMLVQDNEETDTPEGLEELVVGTADEAFKAMDGFRRREGEEIRRLLASLNAAIGRDVEAVEQYRKPAVEYYHKRLGERLKEIMAGAMDPQRLAQEAALLADRGDITEELGRLRVHARELDAMLDAGGELGKKLDFLMQEMNRETNTILSKTSGAGELGLKVTALGLEIKANVERIREQALNLE